VIRFSQEYRNMYGELTPLGGGDPIPLLKKQLLVGRRESCDIVLRFANVSAHHCRLMLNGGYWYVRDMQSRNGVKVNGIRVQEKRIDPGDTLSVAKHDYEIDYSPADLGAVGPPPADDLPAEIMTESLLSRAGLKSSDQSARGPQFAGKKSDGSFRRYDVLDDKEQLKMPDRPV
jgi:adenylate cyclase